MKNLLLGCAAAALVIGGCSAEREVPQAEKPVIETAADLPRESFTLPLLPSELVFGSGPEFDELKSAVAEDARSILEDYHLDDLATERRLRGTLRTVAMLDGAWQAGLDQSAKIDALEESAAARETGSFLSDSYMEAALATGSDEGDEFKTSFRQILTDRITAMDYALAADTLQQTRAQFQTLTPSLIEGSLKGGFDQNAQAQGMSVDRNFASSIVSVRLSLKFLNVQDEIVDVLGRVIDSNTTEKEDRWTQRLVSIEGRQDLTPVVVGNWDSGLDPSVFPGKLWTNENEQRNGEDDDGNGFVDDVHGIAFGYDATPSSGALRPMPEEDVENISELLTFVKGALDLQASVESPAAEAFRKRITELDADEVLPFSLQNGRLGLYLHGTATAYTSQVTNPAARLVFSRFDFDVKAVPDPIDEAFAARFSDHIRSSVMYFKEAGAKVVNMSWRITTPQIEASLATVEPDVERRRERAAAIFETMSTAMADAVSQAPEVLFVAGAGNENEDVEFVKSYPAGINLPNLMTVGAVDVALEPARFTSYGDSIDVYANGFEVPSKAPGGLDINISGTSLAAPQVTNLAAKLWAIDPSLSVAEVRDLIESTTTVEGERELRVIDPQAAFDKFSG